MSIQQDQICATLIKKVIVGQKLNDTEKSHLANCPGCMEGVVGMLDQADLEKCLPSGLASASVAQDLATSRPEVRSVLANAKQVFAREFGISLSGK